MTVQLGSFWERKIVHFTKIFDFEGTGDVKKCDFEQVGERYTKLGNLDEKKSARLNQRLIDIWQYYFAEAAAVAPLTGKRYADAMRQRGVEKIKETITLIFSAFFDIVDLNGTGSITENEFAIFYKVFNLDAKVAAKSFKLLDVKRKGKMNVYEFVDAAVGFYSSDDEASPSKHFYGPFK
jgi:Ca2+-binding EF-hand superfamily protein